MIGRLRGATLAILVGLLVAAGVLQAAAQDTGPQLNVRETTVEPDGTTTIVVSVTGSGLPDVLPADAFSVTESGQAVDELTVEPLLEAEEREPVAVALVVDTSGSTEANDALESAKVAASDLVGQLTGEGVQVTLIAFSDAPRVVVPFTTDAGELRAGLDALAPDGETAVYDALVLAAQELQTLGAQPNIVLFSDGGDTASTASAATALGAVTDLEAPITAVVLETEELDRAALDQLAAESGGRSLTAGDVGEIATAFEQVVRDIASQYVLTYAGTDVDSAELDLVVAATVAGQTVSDQLTVLNAREAAPPPPPEPRSFTVDPGIFGGTVGVVLVATLVFLALAAVLILLVMTPRTRAERVLATEMSNYLQRRPGTRISRGSLIAAEFRERAMALFEAAPKPEGFDEKLSLRLEQAGWPLRSTEFLAFSFLGTVVGLLLGWVLFHPLGGLVLAIVGGAIPWIILSVRRNKRQDRFLTMLPDTLQLLAGSLSAGYGILQAIDTVAKETEEPMAPEFNRVLTEARLGMPLEDALQSMAERVGGEEFRWVVLAIVIQREVGGNLAALLNTVAETLREREMVRRQIKVLSAEGKLSAIVLIVLPIFLSGYLILVRPEYVAVLVTSGLIGWVMVIGAIVLMIIGVFWISRLVKIEV